MKSFGVAVIAIVAIHNLAFSQAEHGTIAVVYYTPSKIIIAADSRVLLGTDDTDTRHEDNACKVAALGDKIVFVSAGYSGYNRNGPLDALPTWRVSDEAHQAYSDVFAELKNKASKPAVTLVAARWGELIRAHITDLYSIRPKAIADLAVDGLLTSAIFSGTSADGHLIVLLVQLKLGTNGVEVVGPKEITTETCPPCALGDGSIFLEFFSKTSERARDEAARWAIRKRQLSQTEFDRLWIIRFVDLTILLYPSPNEVGGFIDALELTPQGVTWIQRKDNCPAN